MAIKSFAHKGLEKFYYNGTTVGINPKHEKKLARILDAIDASHHPVDLKNIFQHRFGEKKGAGNGVYSIEVNGNWRITFEIKDDGAVFLDYLDYHGKSIVARS
ncbi:type II toxin-antitoxin system RelE/ParE family toxin [Enterovibrio nigricans]|uniref:Proteic killer suppression protein n=1 Tax=Enterovibrio nigricans DSM 22720 TaxID=1121868 RepID=A0A1T4W7R6_9GAMM|nr:type II toxin-antitoxin system RelE/ParE family toxin [Enterovibrio nigricans]PKF48833.1 plasmid maintenance system killer [Enterovibrio nigricans]SKA73035.1 proteic killer suppression protein [Enterovibrio nigricans DSM 22720]